MSGERAQRMARLSLAALLAGLTGTDSRGQPAAVSPSGAAFPLSIRDDVGRTVPFARSPRRVVSCYGGFTEMVMALGRGDRLVGVSRASTDPAVADRVARVGSHLNPSVEKVVSLRPDLLVATVGTAPKERFLAFERFGVPVLIFTPTTLEGTFATLQTLSRLLDAGEPGKVVVSELRERAARVAAAVAGRAPVKVFSEVRLQPLMGSGRYGVTDDLIRLARGVNVVRAEKKLIEISLEEVAAADPDVYVIEQGPMDPVGIGEGMRTELRFLRAFRTGRVHVADSQSVKRAGPRLVDGLEALARWLHPEAFNRE